MSIGVSLAIECPVLRRGVTDVGVNDVGVKGVRDAKESVSCDVSVREMVSSFRLQDVASMVMCLQGMSLVGRVLVR